MSQRTEYELLIEINGRRLTRVVIDQHYLVNHAESINDELILDLVKSINGEVFNIESEKGQFQYFVAEPVFNLERPFRLVMLMCICDDYLGVINAFRVDRKD